VGNGTGIDQRIHRAIDIELDGHHRVERQAGAVDAQLQARLIMPEGVTDQGKDKKLGDALDGELLVSVASREQPPAHPGNTHAEGSGRRRCQGRNIVRDRPLTQIAIALVAGRDQGLHVSIGREHPGSTPVDTCPVSGWSPGRE